MKFKDVRTIESILLEYGLKPGAPTPVGNQQSGEVAKTTPQKPTTPPKKDLGSPTVTQGLDIPEPEAPEPQSFRAMDLGDGDEFKDKTGKVVGKVVSKVGDGPEPDKLVVDDGKGEYSFIEPEDEVFIDPPVTETDGKYSKKVHKDAKAKLSKSDSKKNSIKKRIKRLVRSQLSEADVKLFEINFNNPQVAKNSLDLPVRCGFEAETLWEDVSSGNGQDVDDMSYGEIEDAIYLGSDADYIMEGFGEWIRENKADEFLEDLVEEKVDEVKEDEDWLNDFIDSSDGPSSEAVEVYKQEFEEENPTEYENREEDGWEYMNWVREYVEEEYDEIYLDWLRDAVVEEYDLQSDAIDQAYEEYSVDEWISDQFYSMSSMLDDYGVDYSELGNGGLDDIANKMFEGWIEPDSIFKDYPETGQYGDTSTSSWAVETDSSIDGSGQGAEIISPVYDSPREMLEEMKSLFGFFENNSVYTNRSTGLHVTMSWNGEPDAPRDDMGALPGPNKVKMAALLGDNYLLRTFGREGNSYAKEQSGNLRKVATKLRTAASSGSEGFSEIEKTMGDAISGDKFSSINFKSLKDRQSGTNLIEFRIGGGEDYHNDMAKVVKAVVRYATIMEAGYNDDKYTQDYANALYKLVDKASKVDPKDLDRIKDSSADEIDEPLLNLYKDMIGKENFVEGVQDLARAYNTLKEYHKLNQPDADEKWKQEIKDYEKGTGSSVVLDEVETMEPVRAYVRPKSSPPSKRAPMNLEKAQELYLTSMTMLAVDVAENKHRLDVNAKAIGILRSGIKQFYLDSDTFSNKVLQYSRRVNIPTQNDRSDQRAVIIKKGMDKLFKKEIFIAPTFLNLPQSEKIVKGMWNAIHSKGWGREESEKLINLLLKVNFGPDIPSSGDNVHNMKTTILNSFDIRQFNEFYRHLSHGGYNSVTPPAQPGEQYYKDEYKELINFTNNFPEYNEPVAQTFNSNLFSDDSYIENFLSTYTMKMKKRLKHLVEIKDQEPQLYLDTMPVLGSASIKLTKALRRVELDISEEDWGDLYDMEDSSRFLGASNYSMEYLEEIIEDFKNKTYVDPMRGNIVSRLDDRLGEVIRQGLGDYYKSKEVRPEIYKVPEVAKLIKKRFTALKNWMTTIDKIGQKIGFDSQADEIAGKKDIESRNKNFKQTISKKPEVTLNIPGSAISFIRNDLYNDLTYTDGDDAKLSTLVQNKKYFTTSLNKRKSKVYVIPAAHWSQASAAVLIQKDDNPQPSWRLESARKVLKQFYADYGISYSELTSNSDSNDRDEYTSLNDPDNQKPLKKLGIKITREGDSREPHVQPLVPHSQTAQQDVGTPMELSSAAAWHVNNPKLSKKARAADKGTLVSSDNSIKNAADIIEFDGESSNTISKNTNWEKLAVHLGIAPGVNNQGVNLLQKVSDTFDSDHTRYRMEDDRPIVGMTRWLRCIHDAKEYIKKNYKESGGNYFRDGDDVSGVYGVPTGPTVNDLQSQSGEPDYDKARADHPGFNTMMQRGMQDYLPRGQVNNLVDFLNNPDNDNMFKSQVLNTMNNRVENENGPFASFQDALAVTRRQGNESVFAKFDALPLQEQIRIIEQSNVLEGKVIKNNVATKKTVFKESVPDLNRIRIINKLLADHFPAGDLKKQMLAYEAIPVPQMLTDFRGLIAQAGPDACARGIVRHYVNALGDEEKQQINLNEWSKQHIRTLLKEAPMQLVQDFKNLVIKVAELERDVQSKCSNPKLVKQCSYASKELDDYKQKMSTVQNQIMQFTSTEKDVDAAIDLGREQTTSEIRNYQSTVDKLLNKLSDKISGGFNYITFSDNGIEQAKQDEHGKTLNAKNKKKQESEVKSVEQIKQALIGYFKDPELFTDNPEFTRAEILEFLTAAANGEILSMEDIMTIGTDPNLPEMISFPEVVQTAAERHGNQRYVEIYNRLVDDGLMYQTVANTTSGNVGPGELALLLLAAPAEKGARGDLSVDGKEVEIKSGSYSVGDSKTTAGGKFNSDFIVKGNLAGGTLNNLLGKFFKEKLNKDFKKEFKAFMAKQERPNAIRFYKLEPSRMNLPAISDGSFQYVYNPFFKEQSISRDQYRSLARIFSQTTFSSEARQKNGHFYQTVTSLSELHNTTGWYAKQIEEIASTKGIDGPLLKRLIIALQFQSYYLNKGHDQILYINKTNQKITNVTNAKDLIDKFDRGVVVSVKDINLTDTQQTAAHSITAGL